MDFLNAYPYLLAPVIFLARVVDVSLGTFRTIVVFRGYPALAAAIGFVEVLIWVAAASQVLRQVNAWPLMVAYAGGFACGNYLGVWLEARVAIGRELIRVITHARPGTVARNLPDTIQEVLVLSGEMNGRPAEMLVITSDRRRTPDLLAAVQQADPNAEYTISDVKSVRRPKATLARRFPLVPSGWRVRGKRK
jgi:uncharacterized protein YebE (UPF0316 family)